TLEIVQVSFCPRSQNHLEWHGVDPCYKDLAIIRLVLKTLYETAKKKEMIQGIDPLETVRDAPSRRKPPYGSTLHERRRQGYIHPMEGMPAETRDGLQRRMTNGRACPPVDE